MPSDREIQDHYARQFAGGNYGFSRLYEAQLDRVYQEFVDVLKPMVDFSGHPAILDVGCWTGGLLRLLQEAGADVFGLELQPEAVAIASSRFPNRVFQADVHGDIFPAKTFDAITATGLIEHVLDPIKLLSTFSRLLSPGAVLLLETPNTDSFLCRSMNRFWPPYAPIEHLHLFSARAIVQALDRTGFTDVKIRAHWKPLQIDYVYQQLQSFGPALRRVLGPVYHVLPKPARESTLPFYVGEMIVTARRKSLD